MKTNELIAEFMGIEKKVFNTGILNYGYGGSWYEEDELSYNVSWDWLIPVLEKIEMECQGVPIELLHCSLYSEISEVHLSVVEFIKRKNRYE